MIFWFSLQVWDFIGLSYVYKFPFSKMLIYTK